MPSSRSCSASPISCQTRRLSSERVKRPPARRSSLYGVDRLQRPALVEDDAVAEQAGAVEDRAVGVEVDEEVRRRGDTALLRTDSVIGPSLQQALARLAQRLEAPLHPQTAGADLWQPQSIGLAQPVDRIPQGLPQRRLPAPRPGAEAQ
jgi:hypothetical protein